MNKGRITRFMHEGRYKGHIIKGLMQKIKGVTVAWLFFKTRKSAAWTKRVQVLRFCTIITIDTAAMMAALSTIKTIAKKFQTQDTKF